MRVASIAAGAFVVLCVGAEIGYRVAGRDMKRWVRQDASFSINESGKIVATYTI